MMNIEKLLVRESARQDAYKGLADCYSLPDEGLIPGLKQMERVFEILGSDALSKVALMRSEIQGQLKLHDLKVDYARLFVGPYSLLAPPYGSVYLEGKREIMGDSTIDIKKRYAEAGLTTSDRFKEIPDHIRAELEFMYFLIFRQIQALKGESACDVFDLLQKQRSFLQDHLSVWVKDLSQNIERHSQSDFYRHLAVATRTFIEEDFDELAELEITEPDVAVN